MQWLLNRDGLKQRVPAWLVALVLSGMTLAVFWPATGCEFINYDDPEYVTANARVQAGLTWDNLDWAFTSPVCSNWHPLTMLSYMTDFELFGLNPRGFHLTNMVLHALNTALVFLLLRRLTGAFWRSALVAALFGLHPLHVESVAWVAERKDVLSGCFGLLALWAYARFAQDAENGIPRAKIWYGTALGSFALGLMSKPMLVTWPCVLLLLDFWPLNRMRKAEVISLTPKTEQRTPHPSHDDGVRRLVQGFKAWLHVLKPLLVEKLPFFGLAVVVCFITLSAQEQGNAFESGKNIPFDARIGNAFVATNLYLQKIFWPTNLGVFYPHPGYWPFSKVLMSGVILAVISWICFASRDHRSFLAMGWLWFLGTLVPVIGLVQVGAQAMADRYTYLPSLGIFIAVVWGSQELLKRLPYQRGIGLTAGTAVVIGCILLTNRQLGYWTNSIALYQHTLSITKSNYVIHTLLGSAFGEQGEHAKAIDEFKAAILVKPEYPTAHYNLGYALFIRGDLIQSTSEFRESIRLKPEYQANFNALNTIVDINNQAWNLATNPDDRVRNGPRAVELAEFACNQTQRQNITMLGTLAASYAEAGRFDDAVATGQKACALAANRGEAELLKRNKELVALYQTGKPYHEK